MATATAAYSEKQRFRQWWLWLLLLVFPVGSLWAVFQQIILGSPFGNNPGSDWLLIALVLISVVFTLFMYVIGLDTEVAEEGLRIRFWPFHLNWVVFPFSSIQKAEAVTYRPLMDYGGWGIRYGSKGKAYNVRGDKGVFLTLSEGRNLLIGSQNHEELCSRINQMMDSQPK